MNNNLNNLLNKLELLENNAVFFRKKEDGKTFNGFNSDIEKKLKDIKPEAYYIFNNKPFILFFDLSDSFSTEREKQIHKQVWSFDNSPVIFILKTTEISVFNALNYVKSKNGNEGLEEIKLTEEERNSKFSFWNLESGFTWDWLQDSYLKKTKKDRKNRVNERLFENIKEVRRTLIDSEGLNDDEANSLILRLIFIRYLIDREVKIDENYISGNSLNEKRLSFSNLISEPKRLNELFKILNDKFHGVLFKDIDTNLTYQQAESLSQVFKGETPAEGSLFYNLPDFYFEIFDFSIIPVEVISGIYESLISPETRLLDSAVYTPSFLVEYILEDTVQKYLDDNNTSECKIFEVAVGSGIFLVQSLRKMIEKEMSLSKVKTRSNLNERIREITKNNLFGIDTNKEALKVTCFSIYIALLDYQNPKEIDDYEFPNLLGENLFEANFFNTKHRFNDIIINQIQPNYILGNPPWKSSKDEIHTKWLKDNNKTVGRFEIAQSFLLRSKDFMTPYTKTALIVTSTIFYNISKTTRQFKTEFLSTFCINKFFDLSPVRRLIFEEKNSPASIVYYSLFDKNKHTNNLINHQSIKSNIFLKHFKTLVIEKYDQKLILQRHFLENDWMFKVALYGNTLDFKFLKKVFEIKTKISDIIDNKTIFCGDGILKGTPKKEPFTFLLGLPVVENKEVKKYYTSINKDKVILEKDTYLESGREIEKFEGEHIYLKSQALNESEIVVSYNSETAVNRHDVATITTIERTDDLKKLYAFLISDLYVYYQFMSSSAWGTSTRPAIRLREYLSFPLVDIDKETGSILTMLVNSFLNPFKDYYSKSPREIDLPIDYGILLKINAIVSKLYSIEGYEKDLINYVLDVSRYQFQESKQDRILRRVGNDIGFLKKYAQVFIDEFEVIYSEEYMIVEIYQLDYFIAMSFKFSNIKPKESVQIVNENLNEKEILKRLANNLSITQITNTEDPTKNLFIQKDIKGFEKNSFYIIKPNELKSWHRAMAWYDVAEFKKAIEEAEINHIKSTN